MHILLAFSITQSATSLPYLSIAANISDENKYPESHTKITKRTIQQFVFPKCPLRLSKITCAIKCCVNCTRGFNVEEDKGIFGIFAYHILEAPRERVHAFFAFINGHEDLPLLCCHVSHSAPWSDGWKQLERKTNYLNSFCEWKRLCLWVMNVWVFIGRGKIVFWVESVGGFVGFGLLGFSTQWAAFYFFWVYLVLGYDY